AQGRGLGARSHAAGGARSGSGARAVRPRDPRFGDSCLSQPRRALRLQRLVQIVSKLPHVGTTIFTLMARRAPELGAVNMGQGFPDYDIDPRITELVAEAMAGGYNQYAPMEGAAELRQAIAAKLAETYALDIDADSQVTVTLGATEALFSAVQAVVGAG